MNASAINSMAVADGIVFETTIHDGGYYAFNATTGALIWSRAYAAEGNSALMLMVDLLSPEVPLPLRIALLESQVGC
jgi:outer membrane protein assembly factor BamB